MYLRLPAGLAFQAVEYHERLEYDLSFKMRIHEFAVVKSFAVSRPLAGGLTLNGIEK